MVILGEVGATDIDANQHCPENPGAHGFKTFDDALDCLLVASFGRATPAEPHHIERREQGVAHRDRWRSVDQDEVEACSARFRWTSFILIRAQQIGGIVRNRSTGYKVEAVDSGPLQHCVQGQAIVEQVDQSITVA